MNTGFFTSKVNILIIGALGFAVGLGLILPMMEGWDDVVRAVDNQYQYPMFNSGIGSVVPLVLKYFPTFAVLGLVGLLGFIGFGLYKGKSGGM